MYSGVPMRMVSMFELLAFQCLAKPKSHSFSHWGLWSSSSVLSNLRSLQRKQPALCGIVVWRVTQLAPSSSKINPCLRTFHTAHARTHTTTHVSTHTHTHVSTHTGTPRDSSQACRFAMHPTRACTASWLPNALTPGKTSDRGRHSWPTDAGRPCLCSIPSHMNHWQRSFITL